MVTIFHNKYAFIMKFRVYPDIFYAFHPSMLTITLTPITCVDTDLLRSCSKPTRLTLVPWTSIRLNSMMKGYTPNHDRILEITWSNEPEEEAWIIFLLRRSSWTTSLKPDSRID
jgi:hypothetical protein